VNITLSSARADPLATSKAKLRGSNFIRSLLGLDLGFIIFESLDAVSADQPTSGPELNRTARMLSILW
jgi:hypothetical protein